jgi:hypothetical protein
MVVAGVVTVTVTVSVLTCVTVVAAVLSITSAPLERYPIAPPTTRPATVPPIIFAAVLLFTELLFPE